MKRFGVKTKVIKDIKVTLYKLERNLIEMFKEHVYLTNDSLILVHYIILVLEYKLSHVLYLPTVMVQVFVMKIYQFSK